MVTTFSLGCASFILFVKTFPSAKLSSSTLQTIILGLILNNPKLDRNLISAWSLEVTSFPSFNWLSFSSRILISFSSSNFFLPLSSFFWITSISESIISVLIVSRSSTGLIFEFTCVIWSDSKHLTRWIIASTSLMWDKNLFPRPSPLDAPFTKPAISTNVIFV